MVLSMTGFGQGSAESGETIFKVEIKSVNNRFREVIVKMPRPLMALEEPIKRMIGEKVARGRVEVFVRLEGEPPWQELKVNLPLARQYVSALNQLKEALGLPGSPDLMKVAGFKDVIGLTEQDPDMEAVWPGLSGAVDQALENLLEMRRVEGEKLVADLEDRLAALSDFVARIEEQMPQITAAAGQRLKERLEALADNLNLDPDRLAQETAILADKSDVTEELVRLKSHLEQFRQMLDEGGPVGRKLDFLAQEILREINTTGSKSADVDLSGAVIEAKAEQERIREQIQNIE